jgi:hypothetical protein
MELKEVAAVSGRGGLFKILKPTKSGVILEAIDASKKRFVAGANERVSILNEISIYTTDNDGSVPLEFVLQKIHEKYGKEISISSKSSNEELGKFLESVLPDYDKEKVYHSDIKKLAVWYGILQANYPEVFVAKAEEKTTEPVKKQAKEITETVAEEAAPATKKEVKKKTAKAETDEEAAPKKVVAKKAAKTKSE